MVAGGIVGFAVVPGAGEDADGVGMGATALGGALVDLGGPERGVAGVVGEGGDGGAQALVAGEAADDAAALAGGLGDGGDAGFGGELGFGLEAGADVTPGPLSRKR